MVIILDHDDVRLGTYGAEGQVIWPKLDVMGREYVQVNATLHRIGLTQFVVIPPNQWQTIEAIAVKPAPTPVIEPEPEFIKPLVSEERVEKVTTAFTAFQKAVKDAKRT